MSLKYPKGMKVSLTDFLIIFNKIQHGKYFLRLLLTGKQICINFIFRRFGSGELLDSWPFTASYDSNGRVDKVLFIVEERVRQSKL